MTSDLASLAERVEQAAGVDDELWHDIARALGWHCGRVAESMWWRGPGGKWRLGLPRWMESVDAALTLLDPSDFWSIAQTGSALVAIGDGEPVEARANTAALALVSAILRAKSQP